MTKETVKEFVDLKIQEKRIKARIDEIKGEVLKEMKDEGLDKLPTTAGNIVIKKVPVWKWPADVIEAEARVEALQEKAKAEGTATYVEREQIEFRANKKDGEE